VTGWREKTVGGIRASQDAVVVFELPKALMRSLLEVVPSSLLKQFDELRQISSRRGAPGKQVHVVRHDAVGVDQEFRSRGMPA
jgi:hypothetical protein